ncbi:hypothetical protein FKM82_017894 [Ascaphus truei]
MSGDSVIMNIVLILQGATNPYLHLNPVSSTPIALETRHALLPTTPKIGLYHIMSPLTHKHAPTSPETSSHPQSTALLFLLHSLPPAPPL